MNLDFKKTLKNIFLPMLLLFSGAQVMAMSLDWSGNYRFEYTEIDRPSLDDPKFRKAYMLNHLSLSPKIIAADGVNIISKFEVLPNDQYPGSQAGQPFGRRIQRASGSPTSKDDSAIANKRQGGSTFEVNQLYLNINQEYGAFVAGRAPVDFGLGISHNAGNGPFDHWYDTLDMVGYKVVIGNFSLMPMVGKTYRYSVSQGLEVQDMIWNAEYNNPETESAIGIFHQTRTGSSGVNDAPASLLGNNSPSTNPNNNWNTQHINLYLSRGFEAVKFKVEAGFDSGTTGLLTSTGDEVKLNGYGIAAELDFPARQSKWHTVLRTGLASGDNPSSTNYEGFHFSRNYNLAFMMFHHPMGRYDLFRTGAQRSPNRLNCTANPCGPYALDDALDEETISNAVYVSPKIDYAITDKLDWTNRITWAQLQTNPLADNKGTDVSKDLGFEWDLGVTYKPYERLIWSTELGLFFPGAAWQGAPGNNFGKGFTYGLSSKVAITF